MDRTAAFAPIDLTDDGSPAPMPAPAPVSAPVPTTDAVLQTSLKPAPIQATVNTAVTAPVSDAGAVRTENQDAHSSNVTQQVEMSEDGDEVEDDENDMDDADFWESESVISDVVNGMAMGEEGHSSDGSRSSAVTMSSEQALKRADLIRLLHKVGPHEFVHDLLESEKYTPRSLCEALGLQLDESVAQSIPEDHIIYLRALGRILKRELSKRVKLEQYNTFDDAVELLRNSKNVLVLTGAGISTSLGIPDFRSKNGIYNMLRDSPLADLVDDPQDVFALSVFLENPEIFFTVAKSILSPVQKFSPTHSFIRLLQDRDKLLTNYTQNIDNFEACAGIRPEKLVHCHGSFATATCTVCRYRVPGSTIEPAISAGQIPRCPTCLETLARRRQSVGPTGMKRKRSWNPNGASKNGRRQHEWEDSDETEDDELEDLSDDAAGVMKPDIVFFGEDLPQDFHERLTRTDKDLVDLVIVMGTSLMVAPVSEVPGFLPAHVPQIFISREPCRHINFDIELLGDCDVVVAELCRRAGWPLTHHMIPDQGSAEAQVEVAPSDGLAWRHRVRRAVDVKAEVAAEAAVAASAATATVATPLKDGSDPAAP